MNFRLDDTSFEKSKITATITHTGGNIAQAAKIKSPMEKEEKVWTEIMYHFLGGILQRWWYDYCSSVLFILLPRWYICISVVYFVSLR
jgi:Bacterial regulatory protein, Fis family.